MNTNNQSQLELTEAIPDITINEGSTLEPIDLSDYIENPTD